MLTVKSRVAIRIASRVLSGEVDGRLPYDPRWLAIARTHFQEGFMALNRAVFQPTRIKLPEDDE